MRFTPQLEKRSSRKSPTVWLMQSLNLVSCSARVSPKAYPTPAAERIGSSSAWPAAERITNALKACASSSVPSSANARELKLESRTHAYR